MKNLYLLFNDGAGIPDVASTHLGDKGIHKQFSDFIEVGEYYTELFNELNTTEALNGTTPVLDLLTQMTRERTHTHNFYRETFNIGTQALFYPAGTYTDTIPVKSKQMTWEMGVLDLESKVINTTQLELKTFKRNHIPIIPEFVKAMDVVITTYTTKVYPALFYKALFTVAKNGGAYNESFGLLRNTELDGIMLQNVEDGAVDGTNDSVVRNHYRAIAKPSTVAGKIGVTPEDIDDVKKYLMNYIDNENKEIVAFTTSKVINTLASFYTYKPTKDYFLKEGIPSVKIDGVNFIEADYVIPEDFIFFAVYDSVETGALLTKVINPYPEFQGLRVDIEDGNFGWGSVNEINLKEVKVVIGDIDVHLTGRHRGLWLDCGNRPQTNGLMTQDGFDLLQRKYVQRTSVLNALMK